MINGEVMIKTNSSILCLALLCFHVLPGCTEDLREVNSEQSCIILHTDCESMLCIEGVCHQGEAQTIDMAQATRSFDAEQPTRSEDYRLATDIMVLIRDMRVIQDSESSD